MDDLKKRIPETHRKAWIVGGFGAAIGGGIGGYISALKGNFIYAGIGVTIGYSIGIMIGLLTKKKTEVKSLETTDSAIKSIAGIASFVMAIVGLIGFMTKGRLIGLIGALIFAACGTYLLKKREMN